MQMDEVVRLSANTKPLEWLAKALAVTSLTHWSIKKWQYPQGSLERRLAAEMETEAYAACCRLDVWDYRGRFGKP